MPYEKYNPEGKGKPLPIFLADVRPPCKRKNEVLQFIHIRDADLRESDESPCTADEITQMKEDATKQFQELQGDLAEEWASIQKRIPILKDFPMEELWRLCIDAKYQKEGPQSSLEDMNNYGVKQSRGDMEPYFLAGVMRTLHFVLKEQKQEKLTSDYYLQLHDICAEGTVIVKHSGNIKTKTPVDKGYRDIFILRHNTDDYEIRYCIYGLERERYSEEGFEELCQNYDCKDKGDSRYKDQGHPVGRALNKH